jgi:hypothetical protein
VKDWQPAQTAARPVDEAEDEARFGHLRTTPRDSMFLLASLRRANGTEVPVKVRNLSAGGLMAECPVSLIRDEELEADLRGIGPVPARVAWTAGGRIGLAFAQPIDPKLARKPVSGGPQPQLVKASRSMWRPGLK